MEDEIEENFDDYNDTGWEAVITADIVGSLKMEAAFHMRPAGLLRSVVKSMAFEGYMGGATTQIFQGDRLQFNSGNPCSALRAAAMLRFHMLSGIHHAVADCRVSIALAPTASTTPTGLNNAYIRSGRGLDNWSLPVAARTYIEVEGDEQGLVWQSLAIGLDALMVKLRPTQAEALMIALDGNGRRGTAQGLMISYTAAADRLRGAQMPAFERLLRIYERAVEGLPGYQAFVLPPIFEQFVRRDK